MNYICPTLHVKYNNIFLLSDIHLGTRANSIEWIENINNFFYTFYIPFLKETVKNDDILFICGDWFDNRQLIDINVLNVGIQIVSDLAKILPVNFLVGNHDIYKKFDTDINSLVPFKLIKNVTIFEKPTTITNGLTQILVLPWIGNKKDEEAWIKANKTDYLFMHTDISGFRYDNGREISKGIELKKLKIKKGYSGHIHKRQEQQNYVYIGSPYHTKRSDIGNTKGVYVFHPTENKHDFYENNFSPIFQRIKLENLLELNIEEVSKIFSNNYTDIIVPDKWIHSFNLTKFIELLSNCPYKKIETIGEKKKIENEISDILEDIDIRDIPTLLNASIKELKQDDNILTKLQELNKVYYEKAVKNNEEFNYNS